MEVIKISGGYNFRLNDGPENKIIKIKPIKEVGVNLIDFNKLKPKIIVKIGDKVLLGQELFYDKKNPLIKFTSPGGGVVSEINYGKKRSFKSIVIKLSKNEKAVNFGAILKNKINNLTIEEISKKILNAGLWQFFNVFPIGGYAPFLGMINNNGVNFKGLIDNIYVSSFCLEPHGVNTSLILDGHENTFITGLNILKKLSKKTFFFIKENDNFSNKISSIDGVEYKYIANKYPAEKLGTQIWYNKSRKNNEISIGADFQLILNIGHLFLTGNFRTSRLFSIAGSGVTNKHHVLSRIGVKVGDVCSDDFKDNRLILGGLLSGKKINSNDFLYSKNSNLNILKEDRYRIPFVFLRLGLDKLTLSRAWGGGFRKKNKHNLSTSNNGEERSCIQCGYCLDVCPVKLMPALIMKASLNNDIEKMESLNIYDCVDCGLCTFVCPSKIELSKSIEDGRDLIAEEG